jgi:RimJ/RimL family protein N-acetyltransferase
MTTQQQHAIVEMPRAVALVDGTLVQVHRMAPSHASALERFHGGLSVHTTYLRFFSVHPTLSPEEVHRFTHVDHRDREALVATVDDRIVGVARFDRGRDRDEADVAFVVADEWQGLGIGSALFRLLADRAREVGIERFVADTMPQNQRMQSVFRHAGLPCRSTFQDGLVHVDIELGG